MSLGVLLSFWKASFSNWDASLSQAPELCVEVMSPSNLAGELKEKTSLYLAAGACETWVLHLDLTIEIHDIRGKRDASSFGVDLVKVRSELLEL